MKRFIFILALGAGILSGCSETQTTTTRAELAGTYDLTQVGRYLFVTSSDRNELRVLDLESSPRNFVPAPNPLEPLSIPVLARPSNLTSDVDYNPPPEEEDPDSFGHYVYARSFGSQEISIVGSDSKLFQERHRLTTQGLITAFAARTGDEIIKDKPKNSGGSVLYYAEQVGLDAKLFRVELPKPNELTTDSALTPQALSLPLTGMTVTALLVLPPPADQPGQERLVVATRGTMGSGGETFRVVVDNGVATRDMAYDFGQPVRLLATHPRVEKFSDDEWHTCSFDQDVENVQLENPPPELSAGEFVFGVLDESSCGGGPECLGVVAVNAATGARAKDASGQTMIPISLGQALPTGLALAARVDVNLPCQLKDDPTKVISIVKRPLVGIVPMSNGSITLFDAVRMRPFDLDPADAESTLTLVDSTGASKGLTDEQLANYVAVKVLEGVTKNNTYRLIYQLGLPDLGSVDRVERTDGTCPAGSTCFEVPSAPAARVEVGDIIVLRGDAGTCKDANGTEVDYTITGMVAGSPTLLITTPPSALPADCQEMPRIIVRASGAHPFVVTSDTTPYLGRLGEQGTLTVPGSYYYRRTNNPLTDPKDINDAQITLKAVDVRVLKRGDQFVVTTLSHFRPYVFGIDTTSVVAGLAAYRLPGPVVYTRVGDVDFAYVAYPSADGILQVSLEAITENSANTTGLVPFE